MKLRAQVRRPILVKGFEINDGSCADVADGQADAVAFGLANVIARRVALMLHFVQSGKTIVAQAAQARDIDDSGAACRGGIGLCADWAKMIEGVARNANLKLGRCVCWRMKRNS